MRFDKIRYFYEMEITNILYQTNVIESDLMNRVMMCLWQFHRAEVKRAPKLRSLRKTLKRPASTQMRSG